MWLVAASDGGGARCSMLSACSFVNSCVLSFSRILDRVKVGSCRALRRNLPDLHPCITCDLISPSTFAKSQPNDIFFNLE